MLTHLSLPEVTEARQKRVARWYADERERVARAFPEAPGFWETVVAPYVASIPWECDLDAALASAAESILSRDEMDDDQRDRDIAGRRSIAALTEAEHYEVIGRRLGVRGVEIAQTAAIEREEPVFNRAHNRGGHERTIAYLMGRVA